MQTNINPAEWQKLYDDTPLYDVPRDSIVSFAQEPGVFWHFRKIDGAYAILFELQDKLQLIPYYAGAATTVKIWAKVNGK